MPALRFLYSPNGRMPPGPFIAGAVVVYLLGAGSHLLTLSDVMSRTGLWPFVVVQLVLIWWWFTLHAQRLHDAGRNSGLAAGIILLYVLAIALLLILANGFFSTPDATMGNPSAAGAVELILLLYVVANLLQSTHYDFAWVVVAILTLLAFVPVVVTLGFTLWTATRRSLEPA
jgi:uncharacterized membrane protein YhaH (DUF805 family)